MNVNGDKLLHWLAVQIGQLLSMPYWEADFEEGRLAAYKEIQTLAQDGKFSDYGVPE